MMSAAVDILLVDDEPTNLDALEVILTDPAYRLLRAGNADEALRLLLDNEVAAIVLDIKMPGVSGFELARIIKNTRRFRETPIVFLTAYLVDDRDVIAGYGAGGVDYLTKPVNPDILRHKVAVFAELYRKTRELADLNGKLAELNESLEARVEARTAELQASEAALVAAARQKDDFIAILAHELRNPLAPLRTGLDLLLHYQQDSPPPPVTRTLTAMSRQLAHIVRLIDDLLDVSRISRGLLELKRERVDVSAVVLAAIDNARPALERRKQLLSIDVPEGVIATADQTRIAQIVSNLLHNATKFTPEAGSVKVRLTTQGDEAVVQVIDSGSGISPEHLERVFEMFVRIGRPGVGPEPGLGVGLALARRLAELHGGTLLAESAGDGRGATFTLRIPRQRRASEPTAVTSVAPSSSTALRLEVVIVEDNEDIAQGLADLLVAQGHGVSVAETGPRGLELIREKAPDLVLCDLGLPGLDGLDVCRQVRTSPTEHQPMMVALTGWGREDDRRRTKDAGFDHHVVKPIAIEALREILGAASESRRRLGDRASGRLAATERE
jgi:signal transduction histidine kinase